MERSSGFWDIKNCQNQFGLKRINTVRIAAALAGSQTPIPFSICSIDKLKKFAEETKKFFGSLFSTNWTDLKIVRQESRAKTITIMMTNCILFRSYCSKARKCQRGQNWSPTRRDAPYPGWSSPTLVTSMPVNMFASQRRARRPPLPSTFSTAPFWQLQMVSDKYVNK